MVHIKDSITVANISPIIIPREITQKCLHPWPYPLFGDHTTGCLKKTSFSENWAWQILLLIMRNPPSFFLTNAGDSFCNSYIYHLVGLHIRQWQSDSNTTSSLKNNKTIWDKFITCTHTITWRQRTAWNFTCVCKSSIWISHCQQ